MLWFENLVYVQVKYCSADLLLLRADEASEEQTGHQDLLSVLLTCNIFWPNNVTLVEGKWYSVSRM